MPSARKPFLRFSGLFLFRKENFVFSVEYFRRIRYNKIVRSYKFDINEKVYRGISPSVSKADSSLVRGSHPGLSSRKNTDLFRIDDFRNDFVYDESRDKLPPSAHYASQNIAGGGDGGRDTTQSRSAINKNFPWLVLPWKSFADRI